MKLCIESIYMYTNSIGSQSFVMLEIKKNRRGGEQKNASLLRYQEEKHSATLQLL